MSQALILADKKGELSLLPDNANYTNRFNIKSETSNRLYTIAQHKKTGVWSCGCFGWIRYRTCKHLNTLKPLLATVQKEDEQKQLA